jgi:hypothetical protein
MTNGLTVCGLFLIKRLILKMHTVKKKDAHGKKKRPTEVIRDSKQHETLLHSTDQQGTAKKRPTEVIRDSKQHETLLHSTDQQGMHVVLMWTSPRKQRIHVCTTCSIFTSPRKHQICVCTTHSAFTTAAFTCVLYTNITTRLKQ